MLPEHVPPQLGAVDGHGPAPVPAEEWKRIEQAYREIQRRDDRAEYRTWRMERFALALLGVLVVLLGVLVWQWLDHRKVQAFVQVVQVDEQGKLMQIGIPQDLQPALFDRFTPSGRLGLNEEPSNGLGLHICKQLVEEHGGSIYVESWENKGAVFNIDLPYTLL